MGDTLFPLTLENNVGNFRQMRVNPFLYIVTNLMLYSIIVLLLGPRRMIKAVG